MDRVFNRVFENQAIHSLDFTFYLTFPETESEDESEFQEMIKNIINNNLIDPKNSEFLNKFSEKFSCNIDEINYENRCLLALSKLIIKN